MFGKRRASCGRTPAAAFVDAGRLRPHEARAVRKMLRGDALRVESLRARERRGELTPDGARELAGTLRRMAWARRRLAP